MKGVKNTPELRFPEFTESWESKKLKELLEFKNGLNASKENYGFGYKFINVLDIIKNDFITHDAIIGSVNVSKEEFEKNIVEYGDLLFQRSSETREEVGQANVYLENNQPATFGGFVIRGKKIADYDPAFMNYLLKTSKSRKEITTKSGGSTRYNVGQETLSKVVINTTKLPEQTKIADFLTTVDKRINLLTQQKEKLEQYKKGVMQQIFKQQIRFKDDLGNPYPDWDEKKINEIVSTPVSDGPHLTPKFLKDGIPFLSVNNLVDNKIDLTDLRYISKEDHETFCRKCKPRKGDVLVGKAASVGKVAFVDIDIEFNIWSPIAMIRPNKHYSSKYVYYYFQIDKVIRQINKFTNSSSQGNIGMGDINKIKLLIPTLKEQQKIADFLSSIDKKIEVVNQQIDYTTKWKKGLLQKMFV